ncbi:hypothetical protein D9757_003615 [Collybiopsis confluens]|uniref:Uncharacterized protein n=1 Tax=Collybiopsis confluens TaxID=2823264 RepID=A0A8H5MCY2_9AGAR|nr:hypothetical protein D9757_003615 [Collybiopsis confluens]
MPPQHVSVLWPHGSGNSLIIADLWKTLCFRTFPLIVVRHNDKTAAAPGFWRDYFFVLREAEAKRLEEVGSRIRSQRREADERKREREVKLTDRVRLPPPKRQRTGWNIPTQPKSLFQKTRSDASKLQKNMYNARMIPPKGKEYSHSARISGSTTLPPSQPSYSNRVTVKTVIRRPPTGSMETSASVSAVPKDAPTSTKPATSPTSDTSPVLSTNNDVQHSPKQHSPKHVPSDMQSLLPPAEKSAKPQTMTKKDRMASLFVPKHRAHSQLAR